MMYTLSLIVTLASLWEVVFPCELHRLCPEEESGEENTDSITKNKRDKNSAKPECNPISATLQTLDDLGRVLLDVYMEPLKMLATPFTEVSSGGNNPDNLGDLGSLGSGVTVPLAGTDTREPVEAPVSKPKPVGEPATEVSNPGTDETNTVQENSQTAISPTVTSNHVVGPAFGSSPTEKEPSPSEASPSPGETVSPSEKPSTSKEKPQSAESSPVGNNPPLEKPTDDSSATTNVEESLVSTETPNTVGETQPVGNPPVPPSETQAAEASIPSDKPPPAGSSEPTEKPPSEDKAPPSPATQTG